jgi:hypothetical protein
VGLAIPLRNEITMNSKSLLWTVAPLLALAWHPVVAADRIPMTSGFGGFTLFGPSYLNVKSNLIVRAPPIVLDDVGDARISSIFDAPSANSSPGIVGGGEVNYTFSGTRTQIFFGNRLEDLLRLDMVVGLGVRQQVGNAGILAASARFTPLDLEVWADPFVEGEDRQATDLDSPGFRLRWGQVFGTGLELTVTDRLYNYGNDLSGEWLIAEGRLDPAQRSLLDRNGDILTLQALYRLDFEHHRFEPAFQWVNDRRDGAAIANKGYKLQLTYLFTSPKVIVDANVLYGAREANAINPVYGQVRDSDRGALALTLFFPVKRYKSSVLSVFVGGEVFRENANIDFYDSSIDQVMAGVMWRHIRQ